MRIAFARIITAIVLITSTVALVQPTRAGAAIPAPFDSTFGVGGTATLETPLQKSDSVAADIITDTDGNLYVLYKASAGLIQEKVIIGKYTSDGRPVTEFGNNGRTAPLNLWGSNFALQSGGKIVVTGWEAFRVQFNGSFDSEPSPILTYRFTQSGQIDKSFGKDGVRRISSFPGKAFMGNEVLLAVHPTMDYIALSFLVRGEGFRRNFYFIALTPSGSIEYSWGNGGAREVVPPLEAQSRGESELHKIVIFSDGSLLGLGGAYPNSGRQHVALVKLSSSGSLDSDFDGASTNGNGVVLFPFPGNDARMTAITVLQNNEIVLAGIALQGGLWYYAATKVDAGGIVDSTFGSGGFTLSSLAVQPENNLEPKRIGVQADGRFVFNVTSTTNSTRTAGFMRLETDGTLNGTQDCALCLWNAGNNGTQTTSLVVSENKIIWTGASTAEKRSLMRRFSANGTDDSSFNNISIQWFLKEWAAELTMSKPQPDGSILFGGTALEIRNFESARSGVIMKTTSTGVLDTSFGLGGYQQLPVPTIGFNLSVRDFVVQTDGKIIVLAGGQDINSARPLVLMWRVNADGTMDNTFGTNGAVVTTDQNADLIPRALLLTSTQKILVVLNRFETQTGIPWIYRYTTSGVLDPTFTDASNFQGGVRPLIGDGTGVFHTAIRLSDGTILVAGSGSINSSQQTFVARIFENGSIDTSFAGGLVSWSSQHQQRPSFVSKMYVDNQSRIILLGLTDEQVSRTAVSRLSPSGAFDITFNGTGTQNFSYRDPAQLEYQEAFEITPFGTGYVTVGGGSENQAANYRSFSGISRITLNGEMDSDFGTNGILLPFSTTESILTSVTRLSDGSLLLLGFMIDNEDKTQKNFLVKLPAPVPPAPSTPVTTPTTTVAPPIVAPPRAATPPTTDTSTPTTTTPVPPPATKSEDVKTAENIKLVISVNQASILRQLNMTVPKGGKVAMASRTTKVCRVSRARVVAISTGTCRIAVTVTNKKKKSTKVLTLRIS
jgi:uncharacterized delta-60 repeat protein